MDDTIVRFIIWFLSAIAIFLAIGSLSVSVQREPY